MILGASALTAQVGAAPPPPQPVESAAQRDSSSPLDRLVTLELQAVPLRSALHEIASKGNFALEYSSRIVPLEKLVTVRVTKVTVRTALLEALRGTDVEVVATSRGTILLIKRQLPDTGSGTVGGQVVDSLTGRPVNAAAVTVKDSGTDAALGSITNDTGFYWVHGLSAGPHVILVKKIGYMRAERAVVVPIDSAFTRADIFMHATATNLDAVLVTATGPQRRLDLGNDIALLNVDSIAKTEPIESVTQLLENRVPGLEVQHTSGTPGDPSRIRLRGASSVLSSNDPIVIVDGVRIFSAQSDSQSANLARFSGGGLYGQTVVAAPSALDQIDPNSIASIEVFKGPSAATLYGADAANGVIVITTKRGRPGPPRWTMGASRATTFLPGQYPVGVYRFGANIFGNPVLCELGDFSCRADSVVRFQALNDPAYTILGRGNTTQLSLGVSGGADALTYSVTGSTDQATGLLTLPGIESRQFQAQTGTPPPAWMQRPDQLSRWSATSQLMARLNARSDVSLFTSLTHETQQRSDLEGQISMLMGTYVQDSVTFWRGSGASGFQPSNVLLPAFYTRATDDATNFTGGANLNWRPLGWLTASADGGLNVISRSDQILFPQGVIPTDSGGDLSVAHGNTMVTTVNLRATATLPLPLGFRFQLASGANYTKTSNTDLSSEARNLVPGTASLNGAGIVGFSTETANDVTSFGWYLEPTFTHRLVTMTTGLRIDGSSSFGTHVTLPSPKVGVSYVISGEPWFPLKRVFDLLRVRSAYGRAGVWPGPTQQLRLYQSSEPWLNGGVVNATTIATLGNTQIRPERSVEWEGGFDADMLQDALSVGITIYRKMRYDALLQVPVAPSVYGNGGGFSPDVLFFENVGEIRNTGLELSLTTQFVHSSMVSWSAVLNLSQNHNMVVQLGPGVLPFIVGADSRIAAGYPLFGFWARPILGYFDANRDGIIEASEVRLGDSAVYMGTSEPKYLATLFTNMSLFHGAVTATVGFSYQHAFTQLNLGLRRLSGFHSAALADPSSPLSAQAAVAAAPYTDAGLLETVSVLRLNSISVAYNVPQRLARSMGAQAVSLQLQGTNLGLWTHYQGKDPNVNAFSTGNGIADTGVLPTPRTLQVSVRVAY